MYDIQHSLQVTASICTYLVLPITDPCRINCMEDAFKLDEIFDVDSFETLETSPVSYVTRARFRRTQAEPVAIKSASILQEFSKKPHDIVKELRLLKSVSHINVIDVLDYTFEPSLRLIHFWMPFIPSSLDRLLSSPTFTPRSLQNVSLRTTLVHGTSPFIVLAKSLMYQVITAVAYLHEHGISHRDIKPRNIMLSLNGCVKLIDFGVAWKCPMDAPAENGLWPEPPGDMCFDVATGPYRAPELLFGATSYDASATDLWSLGTLCAEFYTSLRLHKQSVEDDSDGDSDTDEHDTAKTPFIIPRGLSITSTDVVWTRDSDAYGKKLADVQSSPRCRQSDFPRGSSY
ncbi:Cyclin-dependent kinase 2 [Grifola frondosa]|uniref:Cyclin-dependent kinase 2 n=1 Tax=Grifola frondosa TaxID=5627 RepID=A0A1C7MTH9_GRIFR|nr:Cyclin-dependent kinase 2 [Grifola frondosa]